MVDWDIDVLGLDSWRISKGAFYGMGFGFGGFFEACDWGGGLS